MLSIFLKLHQPIVVVGKQEEIITFYPAVVAEWSKALGNVHTSSILRSQVQIPLGAIDYENLIKFVI